MYNIEGLDKLMRSFDRLPVNLQKKGLTAAVRKGANVIRDAARTNASAIDDPATASMIQKNIAVQNSRRAGKAVGGVVMRVGVMGGARPRPADQNTGLPGGNTTHWRHIELGSERTAPRPLLRDAARKSGQAAIDVLAQELTKQIAKLELA